MMVAFGRVAAVGATVLLVACSWAGSTNDAGSTTDTDRVEGIGSEEAIAIARDYLGSYPEFVYAKPGTLGDFDAEGEIALPEEPRDRLVWAVTFRGIVSFPCPMGPTGVPAAGCDDIDAEMRVVIDQRTGEVLYEAERPWPQ
jgi:hypothetical protein